MICPRCGHEISEDMLYCEKCGEEIQFVPDFEPEIEQSISDTLSEISIKEFESDFSDDLTQDYDNNSEYYEQDDFNEYENYSEEYNDSYNEEYSDEYADEYVDEYTDDYNEEYIEEYDENYNDEYEEEYNPDQDELYDDEESYYDDDYYDDDSYYDEIDPFDDNYESHIFTNFIKFVLKSKLKWVFLIVFLLIIVTVTYFSIKITKELKTNSSVDHQLELAQEAANDGDYSTAIEYMEKAVSLNPKDTSKKFVLADYYFSNKEDEKAILMFWEIISEGGPNSQDAYRKVINYYIAANDYKMVNEILTNCSDDSIINEFVTYTADEPVFNLQEGTYEDSLSVELTGKDATGIIYYTLDGTTPTAESDVYLGPLNFDDRGIYTISAIYVNNYGISSKEVKKTYTIDISTPKMPNIMLEAGVYEIPIMIEVDVQDNCEVYYTTDGKEPNITSNLYTGPIPMPIGDSNFLFKSVNMEGTASEIADISFTLKIKSTFDISSINTCLLNYDYLLGKAVDTEGHLIGNSSTHYDYQVASAIAYNKDSTPVVLEHASENETVASSVEQVKAMNKKNIEIYYLVTELTVDVSNNSIKTGNYYLCNIETGQLFKANKNEEGYFLKAEEITPDMYTIQVINTEETIQDNTEE